MADTRIWCKVCGEVTDHMHLEGRTCICSVCGETNRTKDLVSVKKNIATRRAVSQASISRTNLIVEKITEEKTMATKLTQEQMDDIRKRMSAATDKKEVGTLKEALAKEYGVTTWTIWKVNRGGSKPHILKIDRHIPTDKSDTIIKRGLGKKAEKAAPASQVEVGGGFKQALERMVAEAVDTRLAGLGLDSLDTRIEAALARILK